MRYDHASLCDVRRNFVQAGRDVFIRKPVKSVPPDAFAIEVFGDCIMIGNGTVRTMECRIEAGDLELVRAEARASVRIGARLLG